jgi:hypothetical protein
LVASQPTIFSFIAGSTQKAGRGVVENIYQASILSHRKPVTEFVVFSSVVLTVTEQRL